MTNKSQLAINYINQAIVLLQESQSTSEACAFLYSARDSVARSVRKQTKRKTVMEEYNKKFLETAKKKDKEWWEMLQQNTLKQIEQLSQKLDQTNGTNPEQ